MDGSTAGEGGQVGKGGTVTKTGRIGGKQYRWGNTRKAEMGGIKGPAATGVRNGHAVIPGCVDVDVALAAAIVPLPLRYVARVLGQGHRLALAHAPVGAKAVQHRKAVDGNRYGVGKDKIAAAVGNFYGILPGGGNGDGRRGLCAALPQVAVARVQSGGPL